MLYTDKTCHQFVDAAASKSPVPGGGSVSAFAGALGTALGRMVGSLTVGKKKYESVENEMMQLIKEADQLITELMQLVQEDMDVFKPLSELYSMKAETESEKQDKERLLEKALDEACSVPIRIMEKCGRAIELSKIFAEKGSRLAVSDAGASAALCRGALQAASLNVYINTGTMKNRERALELNERCEKYLAEYVRIADQVFETVSERLRV